MPKIIGARAIIDSKDPEADRLRAASCTAATAATQRSSPEECAKVEAGRQARE
jgi:hypothetical protein